MLDENGTTVPGGAGTSELTAVNGVIWAQDATSGTWYTYANGNFTSQGSAKPPAPAQAPTPTPTASANDTMVIAGSTRTISDASGNKWTITSGGLVAVNGATDTTTSGVVELAYVNGTVWQENTNNLWWGKTSPTAAWSPTVGIATSPLPATIMVTPGSTGTTVSASQVSVAATSGTNMVFIKGSNDVVTLSGGTNTITDTGSGNVYILPAAGKGEALFTSDILNTGDTLDLKTALAATNWSGTAATLPNYLKVTDSSKGAVLSIAPTSGGTGVAIASITGATSLNLTTLLTHSIS